MPPPLPPSELVGKLCAWIVEGNTIVSCDDIADPEQPLRVGILRIFVHLQHSPPNVTAEDKADAALSPPIWLGYSDTHLFTSSLFPARDGVERDAASTIGKAAYQAEWQGEKRCDITYSRDIIKPTGKILGYVQRVGGDGKTAYVELTEEFIDSEEFAKGRWTDEF